MFAALIRIDAQDAGGAPVTVRLASHDLPQLCHLDDEAWFPAVAELGELAYDFYGGAFTSQVTTPAWSFAVDTDDLPTFSALRWADARVRLWAGDLTGEDAGDPAIGPLDLWFDGELTGEPVHADDRVARFTAQVPDAWLDSSLLPLYAGTGGLEGPDDLEGQPKPLALGNLRFAGGTLIDRAENVWQASFAGYDAASAAYDRVASLGASEGDFVDLTALVAADVTAGRWATCEADGLVKFGAPPDGKVAFDLAGDSAGAGGWVRKAGAMIGRVVELAEGTVNAASLTALDTARPYNLALQLTAQVTPREVIQMLADSVGAVPVVSWTGTLYVLPLAIGTPVAALAADGTSELAVLAVEEREKASPFWRLATEAEPTWVVFDQSEVALDYVWRGVWNADRLYRIDDVVTGEDGRTFAYINATAAAGQALPISPAESNTYWALFGSANQGAQTYRSPADPPESPTEGSLYIDAQRFTYRFEGLDLIIAGEELAFLGEPLETSGYVLVLPGPVASGALQIAVSRPNDQVVYTDVAGEPLTNQYPRTLTPVVQRGGVDIRTTADATYSITTSGITATVNNTPGSSDKGRITVTAGKVGSIDLTVTVAGVAYGPYRIRFSVSAAGAPSLGGTGSKTAQDTTFPVVDSTTYAEVAGPMTLTVATGEDVICTFPAVYSFTAASNASAGLVGRWEHSPAGAGTWTAGPASPITGSDSDWNVLDFSGSPGFGDFNDTITGLTAGDYDLRFMGALTASGTGYQLEIFEGTATVRAEA